MMRRVRRWIAAHRPLAAALAVAGAGAFAFGLYWFQPWKLFVDERVDEPLPPAVAAVAAATGVFPGPRVLSEGRFRSLEHETSGLARMVALPDGARLVRFVDLRTSNGPELVVLLSQTPATDDSWTAYGEGETVTLGPLKGNIGSQNYAVPTGVNLSRFRSVVVWCRRFSVAFGAAPLEM